MDKSPYILHLSSLELSRGGIETFLVSITRELSNRYKTVIASGGSPSFISRIHEAGGHTIKWVANSALDMAAYSNFLELIEQERPSLVHIHDSRAGWIGRLALMTKHIPVIITTHLPSYYYRWPRFSKLRQRFYATIEGLLNRLATTKVIYPSLSGYQYAVKWKIVPPQKAVYIPNGIDLNTFSVDPTMRAAFRKQMGIGNQQLVICALGRLSIEKNFSLIIQAFALIQAGYPDVVLWIAGDGPERESLEAEAKTSGANERIRFLGSETNVNVLLAACDIFSLASLYEGGRTLSIMEAQASGKPCVVSSVGDLPQMVEDGVHGYLFPEGDVKACADAFERLLGNASTRDELGRNAQEKALQNYGIDSMVQGYDRVYKLLLKNETI